MHTCACAHTHAPTRARVDSPHPFQTEAARAQRDIRALPRAMHGETSTFMPPSCADARGHALTLMTVRSLTCAGGICADAHCSAHHIWPWCSVRDIIRSPYLKIRGKSENKASSKAEGGGREVMEAWGVWKYRREWGWKSLICWDAPVADLVLPPLISPA